jgi:hypothetical protein
MPTIKRCVRSLPTNGRLVIYYYHFRPAPETPRTVDAARNGNIISGHQLQFRFRVQLICRLTTLADGRQGYGYHIVPHLRLHYSSCRVYRSHRSLGVRVGPVLYNLHFRRLTCTHEDTHAARMPSYLCLRPECAGQQFDSSVGRRVKQGDIWTKQCRSVNQRV